MAWEGRPAGPLAHPPVPRGWAFLSPALSQGCCCFFTYCFGHAQSSFREAGFFSSCSQGSHSPVAMGSRAQVQGLWHAGFIASRRVASSWTRN